MNDISNYRGIALTSIISKLLDIVIINKCGLSLKTSDYQFGFKEKSSTTQCTMVIKEVINYYITKGTNVYTIFLDASKAFDRVQYNLLFNLLISRNMCPAVARLLAYVYMNQKCRVKWCNTVSDNFSARNGVKQGGVLSPHLFNIYIDELLTRLANIGVGCHIGNRYFGSVAYADDIVLLCPTVRSMTIMLDTCDTFSKEYNITFNANKSKLLIFGEHSSNQNIFFQGSIIPACNTEKHVGHVVGNIRHIDSMIINQACNELYGKTNLLLRQLGQCQWLILYKLFNTYCMSLYGCQLWNYANDRVLEKFCIAWRKCVRRIIHVPYMTHSNLIHVICNDEDIRIKLYKRVLNFVRNALQSNNGCVKIVMKLISEGSQSAVSDSLVYIQSICHHNRFTSSLNECVPNVVFNADSDAKAGMISDFMNYRDSNPNEENITEIIDFLCVS